MMEKMIKRKQRVEFNQYFTKEQVLDFLEQQYGIVPDRSMNGEAVVCEYDENNFRQRSEAHNIETNRIEYNSGNNAGKFFESQLTNDDVVGGDSDDDDDGLNFMDSNIFDT